MIDRPNFKLSRRGYEPAEVDDFIETQNRTLIAAKKDASERSVELTRLNAALADMRGQLGQQARTMAELKNAASNAPSAPNYASFGERIGTILSLAEAEAAELRAQAQSDSEAIRERAGKAANDLKESTSAYATEARARADEEAAKVLAHAQREAQQVIAEAQSVAAAHRQEAAAEFEGQRAKASAATAELEATLAERREKASQEFAARREAEETALAEIIERARHLAERSERDTNEAQTRAKALVEKARAEADELVSEARDHASRLREESEREVAAATAHRDSITAQLANVRQMLATLGTGAVPEIPHTPRSASPAVAQDRSADGATAAPKPAPEDGKPVEPSAQQRGAESPKSEANRPARPAQKSEPVAAAHD